MKHKSFKMGITGVFGSPSGDISLNGSFHSE